MTTTEQDDAHWMQLALAQARLAAADGEIPVGAVVVKNGVLVSTGRNAPIAAHDPTAHAEMLAVRAAAQALGNYRLDGCTLYVTLEPCAMCSGAMLHARLDRVVFGASDPKTGAAGGALDIFNLAALNHRTRVTGGVLGAECGHLLQSFFKPRRVNANPLRQDALRTPDGRFSGLTDFPWAPHYVSDLGSLGGFRMHYVDEGCSLDPKGRAKQVTFLCLHGNLTWGYLYRHMMPVLLASGARVVAPDFIGFGRSDKPKKAHAHSFSWHRNVLLDLITHLDLRNVVLVVQGWGGTLGLTLPPDDPARFQGLLLMNTLLCPPRDKLPPAYLAWQKLNATMTGFSPSRLRACESVELGSAAHHAYSAPFPDAGHCAALRVLPDLVPGQHDDESLPLLEATFNFWHHKWTGKTLMAIGRQDLVHCHEDMLRLHANLQIGSAPMVVEEGGHFLPEQGRAIAERWFAEP